MYFVGREKEIKQMNTALTSGQNIIVYAKYGMGRTALVSHVAKLNMDKWQFHFADFSLTPEQVCRQLFAEFFPDKNIRKQPVRYKKMRREIVNVKVKEHDKLIIVLDNIEKITHQRIDFLRYLSMNGRFAFIAIVENSLPEMELLRLRGVLQLSCQIQLSYLKEKEVAEAIQFYSDKYHLDLTDKKIKNCCRITRGYPLFLNETVAELKNK